MLCALVIGHTDNRPGAVNELSSISEFEFNSKLARKIVSKKHIVEIQRIFRESYMGLPKKINAENPDFIISLHCNAFNKTTSGTEVLYYHTSNYGRALASILQRHLVNCLELPDRGIKPKQYIDRGGYILRRTKAPCVIAEPFFIDNSADLIRAQIKYESLVEAYINTIEKYAAFLERR